MNRAFKHRFLCTRVMGIGKGDIHIPGLLSVKNLHCVVAQKVRVCRKTSFLYVWMVYSTSKFSLFTCGINNWVGWYNNYIKLNPKNNSFTFPQCGWRFIMEGKRFKSGLLRKHLSQPGQIMSERRAKLPPATPFLHWCLARVSYQFQSCLLFL